jgi:hypothetical protein
LTYRPAPVSPGAVPAPAIEARLAGIVAVGVIVMGYARFALRSVFFQTPRESARREP